MKINYIKWGFGALGVAAAVVLLDALFLEQYFFEVKSFDIGRKGGRRKIRLLLLTDLHFKDSLLPRHRKLASTINRLRPDLILIAGDTLDSSGDIRPVGAFLSLLDSGIKKVAVAGNHDHKAEVSISRLKDVLSTYNGELLLNQSAAFQLQGKKVVVTGLDDFIESESRLHEAVRDIGQEEHHLLLLHSPLQQEQAKREIGRENERRSTSEQLNVGYIFAGHNHGGQVRLPGYVPYLPGKSGNYVNGWYNESAPFLYVSKGFGTSTLPIRFFARAEVTLFNYFV